MNTRKIVPFFLGGLIVSICARFFQITKVIDFSNGFFDFSKEVAGYLLLLVILVACVVMAVMAFTSVKDFVGVAKPNWIIGISAGFVAFRLLIELFGEVMSFAMPPWQVLVVKFVTVITAIYFGALLFQSFIKFKIPPMLHAIPAIYAITKTIFTFINISALSVISDNILLMGSYCVLMLFFINYARLYNAIETQKSIKKVVAYGLVAATLCITCSLPTIIVNLIYENDYVHSNISVGNTLLTIGCFIVVYVCEYIYNAYNKKEHI